MKPTLPTFLSALGSKLTSFKNLSALLVLLLFSGGVWGQSTANYSFSSGTASLDLMVGASSVGGAIVNGYNDDNASAVNNIGFNFVFMGVSYSQFSVNSNGQLRLGATVVQGTNYAAAAATTAIICPMSGDNSSGISTPTVNPVTFKVSGSEGSKILIVQWINFNIALSSTSTNGGTMQLWLYEGTGKIEFHYGSNYGCSSLASRSIFISSSNTATTSGYVTVNASPTFTATATALTNSIAAGTTIANLSGVKYTFTPPTTPVDSAPTTLTYSAINTSTTTVNWVDNSTVETNFLLTRATDSGFTQNVIRTIVASTTTAATGGAYNSVQSSLQAGTTYYYKVQAMNEGQASSDLTGSQATNAGATYYWVGATGAAWGTTTNWNTNAAGTGTARTSVLTTDVLIVDGAGTTAGAATIISVDVASFSIGQLKITNNTACTLQSSISTTRVITITGGPNDDFVVENGSTLNLNHATNAIQFIFSGTGTTGDISGIVNFAGSLNNLITTTGGTSTLVTVNSTGVVNIGTTAINLVGSAATLSFTNGSNCNVTGATTAAYPIPLATWAANSTVTLSGSATSSTPATNKSQAFGNFVVNLPSLPTGVFSFWTSSNTASIQGNLIITSTGLGSFRAVTSGSLIVSGNLSINGGIFQHSGGSSGSGTLIILGNTSIASGATLDLDESSNATLPTFSQRGTTFTNNGIITFGTTTSRLSFYSPTNAAMTLTGTGTVTGNLVSLSVQTTGGLTISHANQIPTLNVYFYGGTITGSGKLTIGTGSNSSSGIQIGSTGLTTSAGGFDVSPTWTLGSGGLTLFYSPELGTRTTGYEIPPTRTVTNITVNNNGLTIAGGNLNVSSTLTMTAGVITSSSSNVLSLGTSTAAGTLAITSPSSTNMIVGPFARTFALSRTAAGTYNATTHYPVGKGSTYSPIWVDPTTTSGGAVIITSESFTSNGGSAGIGVTNLSTSNWSAQATTGSANLTSARVRFSDTGVTTTSKLLQAATATGSFEGVAGGSVSSGTSGTVTSNADLSSYTGYFAYGDLASCTTPSSQPTDFSAVSNTTSVNVSFTAASGSPTGYLVVRGATGFTPTPPSDQTDYTTGAALGTGTIVGNFINVSSFTSSSLTAETTYDYYIYAFNNSGCAGPSYNTTSPLSGTITTCAPAPTSPTATLITGSSFSAGWVAVTNAASYVLDVSTSATFASFVSGYQELNVGNVTTYAVSNLSQNTTYYYRVRAVMSGCTTDNSSRITVITYRIAPWSENFDTGVAAGTTVVGASTYLPAGWLSQNIKWSTTTSTTYNSPKSGSYYLRFAFGSNNADVFTPGFYLTSGIQYTISYWAQTDGYQGWTAGLFYNTSQSSTGVTQIGSNYAPTGGTAVTLPATNAYVQVTNTFTPTSSGVYYFSVRGNQPNGTTPWYMAFDDFALQAPCTTSTATPTNMVFGTSGTGTVTATYTANAVAPSGGYVVVRFPNGTTPTAPSNSTTYVVGDSVGSNGGVVTNLLSTLALGFTAAGLSPNTSYDFYVYPYSSTSCTNGPTFGSPLMGTNSTASCPNFSSTLTVDPSANPVAGSVYSTLTAAILELSGCGVTEPMVIELANTYSSSAETFPIVLRSLSGASSTNTITIRPASNVSTSVSITGASSGSQIFNIDGGNYWVIDGRAGGTGTSNNLIIENTGVLANSTSAVRLINGAQNNVIKYCTLRSSTTSTTSNAVVTFSSSNASVGNSFNTLTYCNIDCNVPTVGTSTAGIVSNPTGTSLIDARFNNSNTITYNNIYGFYNATNGNYWGAAILLTNGYNSDWTISDNSIYQTSTMGSGSTGADCFGIYVNGINGGNFTISNNYIGGSSPNCVGTMTLNSSATNNFRGMYLSLNSANPSTVSNNTISNINFTSITSSTLSNGGISFLNGAGTISGNTISNISFNSSTTAYFNSIIAGAGTVDHNGLITISNNTVSGVTIGGLGAVSFIGIRAETSGTPTLTNSQYSITGNVIGHASTSNSISSTTNGLMYGIYSNSLSALNNTISNNTIANITSTNATGSTNLVYGIYGFGTSLNTITSNNIYNLKSSYKLTTSPGVIGINSAATTAGQTISGNSIYNLTNTETAAASSISGISFSGTTTGTNNIEKNNIYNLMLSTTSTSGAINGITITGYPITASNNMVRLGLAIDASAITTGYSIFGIKDAVTAGSTAFYFNSIYVGSTSVSGVTSNTFAFSSAGTTNTRIIRNNIFSNVRSGGSTGKHYALGLAGVSSLTNNNNDYFTGGSLTLAINGSTDIASLNELQTATSQDASSVSTNPNFINATAATPNLKINNSSSSLLESSGANITGITTDIEGDARPGPSGSSNGGAISSDIGADEFDGILGKPIITLTSASPNLTTQCSSTARIITMDVNTAGTLTAAPILNYSINGVTQTAINMTAGTGTLNSNGTWTATIPTVTPVNGTVTWSVAATNENTTSSFTGTSYSDAPVSAITLTPASATICNGSSQSIEASGGVGAATVIGNSSLNAGTINLEITDYSTTGVSNTLAISSIPVGATITKVDVTFNLSHAWLADAEVTLTAPNGKIIALAADQGPSGAGSYNNVVITSDNTAAALSTTSSTITGTYKANATASASLYGSFGTNLTQTFSDLFSTPNGNWKLSAYDDASGDVGTLNSWSIVVTYSYPQYSWSPTTDLYTDTAATIAYTGNPSTVYAKPTTTTTYTITATASNGCTSSNTVTITVTPTNTAGTASSSPTLCISTALTNITHATTGATGIGTATSLPAGVTAAWASNTITISGTPTASGTFNYTIPLTGGCGSVNATGTITVNPLPTALVLTGSSACAGATGSITSSTSVSGVDYQLYDSANAAVGSVQAGTGSGLTWSSVAIATGYYAKATNATTSCVSSNSNNVAVATITDKTWLGTTDNSWNTASNWSCGTLPSASDVIIISSGSPVLDTNFTVGAGGSLTLSGSGTLTISPTSTLTVTGTANFGGKAVTIKSNSSGNGALGQVTGTLSGATNVTVERYIPAKRSWRAITAPVTMTTSINANWQEGSPVTGNGYGFDIWSNSGGTGIINGGTGSSLLAYDSTTNNTWSAITNTTTASSMMDGSKNKPFMAFVTGPYGTNNVTAGATVTTLRATGTLLTGDKTYATVANKYTFIGNPYASPLDLTAVLNNTSNATASFSGNVWVWDANVLGTYSVGTYNLFDFAASNYSYTSSNANISGAQIQSGQAFFVKSTNGANFSIKETHKGSVFTNAVFRSGAPEILRVNLYKQVNNEWAGRDGAMTVILQDANANQTPNKMANGTENIVFTKNGANFASNHHLPLVATDVLNVKVWNTTTGANYKLKINTEQFATTNLDATLEDLFTNARTPLSLDGSAVEYPFTVTTDALSTGDRFRIVFQTSTLGTTIPKATSFSIIPNPVTGDSFQVNLGSLATGTYSYSICNALGQEVEKGSINTTTQNTNYTVKFRETAATGIYIMKIKGSDNSVFTAKLIKK